MGVVGLIVTITGSKKDPELLITPVVPWAGPPLQEMVKPPPPPVDVVLDGDLPWTSESPADEPEDSYQSGYHQDPYR